MMTAMEDIKVDLRLNYESKVMGMGWWYHDMPRIPLNLLLCHYDISSFAIQMTSDISRNLFNLIKSLKQWRIFFVSQLSFSNIFTSQKLFESHQFNRIMTIRTIDYRFLSNFRSNYFNLVVILDFRFYNWTNWSSKKYVLISLSHALLCPNGWINNVFTF